MPVNLAAPFVFRELEQNTKLFGIMEEKLSSLLGLTTATGGLHPNAAVHSLLDVLKMVRPSS
jgi:hypothetical protein